MYHIPLAFQCTYECGDEESENGDGEDRSEIPGGGEMMEIAWSLVCK